MLRQISALTLLMVSLTGTSAVMAAPKPFSSANVGGERVAQVQERQGVPGRGSRVSQARERQGGMSERGERFFGQLNLSAEQRQQMQALREQHQAQMSPMMTKMQEVRQELHSLMSNNASEAQLQAKHREIQQLMQQMGDLRFAHQLEVRQILTPEQQRLMGELMQEKRDQHQQRGVGRQQMRPEGSR